MSDELKTTKYPPPAERRTGDHLGRTNKDFAIEFGECLAASAEQFLAAVNETFPDSFTLEDDLIRDHWAALQSAIYEFRARAASVKRPAPNPRDAKILIAIRSIARG